MSINSKHAKSFSKLENVLIIGNGGRENSLAWAIQKNELVKKVYLIPGNAGSERINKCERIKIDVNNKNELVEKLNCLKVDLIVMGAKGIDLLQDSKSTTSKVLKNARCPVLIVP